MAQATHWSGHAVRGREGASIHNAEVYSHLNSEVERERTQQALLRHAACEQNVRGGETRARGARRSTMGAVDARRALPAAAHRCFQRAHSSVEHAVLV
jgi:hypothetical protein